MEDKSHNDTSPREDGLSKKLSVRKGRSAGRTSYRSVSTGGETTTTVSKDQTKTSNPDSCEQEKLDGHDRLAATEGNIQVKEEQTSSGEEDTSSWEGDLRNIETGVDKDSAVNQLKRGRDMSKCNIGRSKEISEDLRKQVVEAHKSGKGYKRIAKDLDLHRSTVRQIVYKWKKFSTVTTLPRSGRPTKISARARRTILKHMTENPRVTAKDLKASLALDNINVHESTIRKTLNKWCSWDFTVEEATALQQE
ncbi:PREDICTED: uncharacterized protein LOC108797728 [Nanorana parkeri]|uniref:uncharacterized protein LOC108797728 n=1 Tax=Nanorana parkeri TaxID=125878 RepID=UPI000854BFB0|nr:PREDICTED: uncharacterized protein LOC108797728 [Nanorana parkeri]